MTEKEEFKESELQTIKKHQEGIYISASYINATKDFY